jgi:hypothetical protein
MPSKSEQILQVIKAVLETIPDIQVERNSAVSTKIPTVGLIIIRDGDPGDPDLAIGGVGGAYYSHQVEIEIYVQNADSTARDLAFDSLLVSVGEVLSANSTLGGLSFGLTLGKPSSEVEAIEGAPAIKIGILEPVVEYETNAIWSHCGPTDPLLSPPACSSSVTFLAAEDLEPYRLITLNQDARAIYADQTITGSILGITLASALTGEAVTSQIFGPVTQAGWSWDINQNHLFLGNAGMITQTPPTSGILVRIGSVISPTEIFINIEPAIQLL